MKPIDGIEVPKGDGSTVDALTRADELALEQAVDGLIAAIRKRFSCGRREAALVAITKIRNCTTHENRLAAAEATEGETR